MPFFCWGRSRKKACEGCIIRNVAPIERQEATISAAFVCFFIFRSLFCNNIMNGIAIYIKSARARHFRKCSISGQMSRFYPSMGRYFLLLCF